MGVISWVVLYFVVGIFFSSAINILSNVVEKHRNSPKFRPIELVVLALFWPAIGLFLIIGFANEVIIKLFLKKARK